MMPEYEEYREIADDAADQEYMMTQLESALSNVRDIEAWMAEQGDKEGENLAEYAVACLVSIVNRYNAPDLEEPR